VYHVAVERDAEVIYDSIGVGASSGAKFNELNAAQQTGIKHNKFNAGGAVWQPDRQYAGSAIRNRDMFCNLKAQAWWLLADRFRNTYNAIKRGDRFDVDELISMDSDCPHLDKLIDELCTPLRDYDQNGRVKVESKKDLARRDVPSPNLADAAVMAFSVFKTRSFFG